MNLSSSGSSASPQFVNKAAERSAFYAQHKIVPISLITTFDVAHLNGLTGNTLPIQGYAMKSREELTKRQSNSGERPSMYARLTRGGLAIQDNGFEITELQGIAKFADLKPILQLFRSATYIWINEGKMGGRTKWKKKIEFRNYFPTEDSRGAMNFASTLDALETIPDDSLMDVRVWMNPDNHGWWAVNIVVRCWDQTVNGNPVNQFVSLPVLEVQDIPSLDLEAFGFKFGF